MGNRALSEQLRTAGAESLAEFENLLASFERLPNAEKKPFTTLLEIAKFPRSELACSNILAFFLNPNEEHNLGGLVLKSLLEAADPTQKVSWVSPRSVEVRREERTDSNKSIDVVLVGESFVVGIENKIDAEAYNPFKEYKNWLEKIAKGKAIPVENVFKILLSIDRQELSERLHGFTPLTYDKFFSVLLVNIGPRMLDADQRYWIYLIDFITTIQNLRRQLHMNKDLLDFFKTHEQTALKFNLELQNLKELLSSKTKKVYESVERPERFPPIRFWSSVSHPDEADRYIYGSCYCDTEIAGVAVRIDVALYIKRGWEIVVWLPKGGDFPKLCKWLEEHNIRPVQVVESDKHWIYYKDPDFSIAEGKVGAKFQELLEAINTGRGEKAMQTITGASKRRQ